MQKVNISLVGGQPAPVYNVIEVTRPDVVVFICSDSDESQRPRKTILSEIERAGLHIREEEQSPLDTTDPLKIQKRAKKLANQFKDDEVTLNISGGLKSWSHIFGMVFQSMPNARVVYMDQNNILWDYREMTGRMDFNFNMFTQFRLYGNPIDNHYTDFTDYTEDDYKVCTRLESLRKSNLREFTGLLAVLTDDDQRALQTKTSGTVYKKSSKAEWEKAKDSANESVTINLVDYKGVPKPTVKLESPHAISLTFNSGWFEYKVAHILSKWDRAAKVVMNCHFPTKKGIDKNEVDIIIDTGPKLLFVECKTQIAKSIDIDKFRSVVKGYGGLSSKALFVTDSPMREPEREKCSSQGILAYSLKDGNGEGNYTGLFEMLEKELFNINAR